MAAAAEQLRDEFVAHHVNLLRVDAALRAKVLRILDDLAGELRAAVAKHDPAAVGREAYRQKRLTELLAFVERTIRSAYGRINRTASRELIELAEIEATFARGQLAAALADATAGIDVRFSTVAVPRSVLEAIAADPLVFGGPASQWWRSEGQTLASRFARAMRMGLLAGEGTGQMVERVMRPTSEGGAGFAGSMANAEALTRTSVSCVTAEVRRRVYRANGGPGGVVKGTQQLSTLDGRTSQTCTAYSGATFDLDGKPVGHSLPYNGGVPRHWSCRSVEVPWLKSWRELGIDLDEVPPGKRASMDGEVPADITFDEWLKRKSSGFQDSLLGKGKADLWRAGKITLTDLVNMNGRPLSLAALRAKYADA